MFHSRTCIQIITIDGRTLDLENQKQLHRGCDVALVRVVAASVVRVINTGRRPLPAGNDMIGRRYVLRPTRSSLAIGLDGLFIYLFKVFLCQKRNRSRIKRRKFREKQIKSKRKRIIIRNYITRWKESRQKRRKET